MDFEGDKSTEHNKMKRMKVDSIVKYEPWEKQVEQLPSTIYFSHMQCDNDETTNDGNWQQCLKRTIIKINKSTILKG